jgi:hypothetical protein
MLTFDYLNANQKTMEYETVKQRLSIRDSI